MDASPTMSDLKHERRCELGCEWTDRLLDLKRWGNYDKIRMALHGRSHADKTNPDTVQARRSMETQDV